MENSVYENHQGSNGMGNMELTNEQLKELLDEQRILISEMKQTQSHAEMAYSSIYQKYAQAVLEKSLLQTQVQDARKEVDALVHSRSFRITAPLRALKRRLRGWIK